MSMIYLTVVQGLAERSKVVDIAEKLDMAGWLIIPFEARSN